MHVMKSIHVCMAVGPEKPHEPKYYLVSIDDSISGKEKEKENLSSFKN